MLHFTLIYIYILKFIQTTDDNLIKCTKVLRVLIWSCVEYLDKCLIVLLDQTYVLIWHIVELRL